MIPKLKNIIIFSIIIIIIILIYVFFFNKTPEQGSLTSSTAPSFPVNTNTNTVNPSTGLNTQSQNELSDSFLSLLLGVENIKLDDSIFKDGSAFFSLNDSSMTLVPDGTEGRLNPFAPIGTDGGVSTPPVTGATTQQNGVAPSTSSTQPTQPTQPTNTGVQN